MALDHEAIYKAYAGTVVSIDDSVGAFDASGNSVSLDQSKIDSARATLDAEAAAILYQKQRTGEAGTTDTIYDTIGNQLDMLFKAIDADSELKTKFATWHTHISAVKAKYPKP
tara:strand:+ start:43 stop:381 length:339 start_codon:yes stop_codon:yes gene_type:complete